MACCSSNWCNDPVVTAHDRVDESNRGADFHHVRLAPGKAQRVLDPALDGHDLQQRMVEQSLRIAADQRVKVPEPVDLHQIRVVTREHKVRIVLQKQIPHVVQWTKRSSADEVSRAPRTARSTADPPTCSDRESASPAGDGLHRVVIDHDPSGLVDAGSKPKSHTQADFSLMPRCFQAWYRRPQAAPRSQTTAPPTAGATVRPADRPGRFRG